MRLFQSIAILFFTVLTLASCGGEYASSTGKGLDSAGTYYSVNIFARDQWEMYYGQPYMLEKVAVLNGQKDSSLVAIENMDWGAILKIFSATDISNKKYLGQYDFSMFDNNLAASKVFYYQAKDPKLFTQVLEINVDPFNSRIRSIYIETAKHSFWNDKIQKLYYAPLKTLQIQETEKPFMGDKKELKVTYKFMV
ncbi:hypothetical protein [Taibaiella soli]|uniref:Lipoprotein n=1 Tax=Taibaiella soli TaxID=1649169 RepID=A0A2W2AMH9_9BACT|nr:hypothetical protein [Taibaiella soli]PZF73520.1 hypothetical protein DN068_07280 [Taibaiella soli]